MILEMSNSCIATDDAYAETDQFPCEYQPLVDSVHDLDIELETAKHAVGLFNPIRCV